MSTQPRIPEDNNIIPNIDYSRMKVGLKQLEDATYSLGTYKQINPRLSDKKAILDAIQKGDIKFMREVSNFYFKVSGIYSRLCKHLSNFYRYDWRLIPFDVTGKNKPDAILDGFNKASYALDDFGVKLF